MSFALVSGAYLALLLTFWFGLGRALARWLAPNPDAANFGTHALNGFAVATLAATVGYRLGAPFDFTFRGLAALCVLGCVLHTLGLRHLRGTPPPAPHTSWAHLLGPVLGGLFLFLPVALGGLQFALFRSNHYDALNYLQAAVARLSFSHTEIATAGPAEFLQNPLLVLAQRMVTDRPAITDSYALTDGLLPGNLHQLSPSFLIGLLILAVPAMASIASRLGASRPRAWLIGFAGIGGFWGQYVLDLDAWSLLGAIPLVLTTYDRLDVALDPTSDVRPTALSIAVPAATLILTYPELVCFSAPALLVALVLSVPLRSAKEIARQVLSVLGATALLIAPCASDVWGFVSRQITSAHTANHAPLSWTWHVLFGLNPDTSPVLLTVWQTLAGALGIFLPWSIGAAVNGWNFTLLFGGALGLAVLVCAACAVFRARSLSAARVATTRLTLFTIVLIAQSLAFALFASLWTSSKALSYSFPWVLLVAFLPLCLPSGAPRALLLPASLLLTLQLALLLGRPLAALDPDGVGYPAPYPASDPALKLSRRWETNHAPRSLAPSSHVHLDVPDVWLEYYAMICAQAQRRTFTKSTPVREYYDMTPKTYGQQIRPSPTAGDGLVFVEFDPRRGRFSLGFVKGNQLWWSGARKHTIHRIVGPSRLDSRDGLLTWWGDAELEVQSSAAQPTVFECLLRGSSDLTAAAPPAVAVFVNDQLQQRIQLGAGSPDTLQGFSLPLQLPIGTSRIRLTAEPGGHPVEIGFSNPRLTSQPTK
jgi:hypothetical protein